MVESMSELSPDEPSAAGPARTAKLVTLDDPALANIEIEQALLGAVLISCGSALDSVNGIVTPADFSEGLHAVLFEQFTAARNAGRTIDVALAQAALGRLSEFKVGPGVGVPGYIVRLATSACSTTSVADYAKTIRECADRRRLVSVAHQLTDGCAAAISPTELATVAIDELDTIASTQPGKRTAQFSIAAAAGQAIERMQWGMQNPGKLSGISWGISDLDAKTGGLQRGELIVLAGRPGMGKSGLVVSCVLQSAKAGSNVLMFSHEMTAQAVADRALADCCFDDGGAIAYHDISRGRLSNSEAERVVLAAREFVRLSIKIDEQPALTVSQIAARARKHAQRLERQGRTLDLIVVDHMHLVRASDRYTGNRVNEITEISGGLKALAKELNVPVVALAQLSRAVESRDDKRPTLSDLRDSGAIEQDADLILFVYREAYYLERAVTDPTKEDLRLARLCEVSNSLEAIIAKQRNGPVGTVPLFFNAASNAARNPARRL